MSLPALSLDPLPGRRILPILGRTDSSELGAGKFLIASRRLGDPNFSRSVILLLEYGRRGAMGVIINRPTHVSLSTLLPDLDELRGVSQSAFVGGPVGRTGMLLLVRSEEPPEPSLRVFADVFASGSAQVLRQWVIRGPDVARAYVGHAGWGPGQLDGEVGRGDWYVSPADASKIFSDEPARVWKDLIDAAHGQWAWVEAISDLQE